MSALSVRERMDYGEAAQGLSCSYCAARPGQPCVGVRGKHAGFPMWPPHATRVRLAVASSRDRR